MKRYLLTLFSIAFSLVAFSQSAPKFASKAQKAILSLNTYDNSGTLMKSGTAFFVGQNGDAIADLALFKGAYKAIVIDASGKQYDVDCIQGADDTYSVVRFKVNAKNKEYLTPTQQIQSIGTTVYALNYQKGKISTCPQGTIEGLDSINSKYGYYSLSSDMGDEYVGGPVFNEAGELIGLAQSALGTGANRRSYALDIRFRDELNISAIQSRSAQIALASINIEKGIPDTQEETLVYTYFKSRTATNEEYLPILNRFVNTFPDCAEAYSRRATVLTDLQRFDEAKADLDKHMSLSSDKAVANMTYAQAIYNKVTYMPEPDYPKWTYDAALEFVNKSLDLETAQNRDESKVNITKAKILKAQILMGKKDYDGAISLYEDLNQGEGKNPSYLYAISLAKEARGDSVSTIIADLDSAIAMFGEPMPADAASFVLRRGQLYKANKQYRPAVKDYNQYAFLMNSQVSDIFYYDRSQLEVEGRMFQQALDDLNSAINIAPNKPLYYIEKAGMCLRVGMTDEAIETCTKVLQLSDQLVDAYRLRGYAYVQKKNMTAARADLQKAIDLGDENAKELMNTYVK